MCKTFGCNYLKAYREVTLLLSRRLRMCITEISDEVGMLTD